MTAKKDDGKRYAYLILDVVIDDKGIDAAGYEPNFAAGEIMVREDFPGLGGHDFKFEDGPLEIHLTVIYVGQGTVAPDGDLQFDYATSRLLQLCKIAWEKEQFLNRMIHDVLDKAKEILVEIMGEEDGVDDTLDRFKDLEKELVK